jgi:Uma2 family endonuclease
MPVAHLIPVEEYLHTDYEPDRDYVDGELEERNLGERDHGDTQGGIYTFLKTQGRRPGVFVFLEQRIQISPTRFRVPDICIVAGERPKEQIFTRPPLAVVEVLSPEDRIQRMQRRVDDYLNFGVRHVWLIDPTSRRGWVCDSNGMHEAKDGMLRTDAEEVALDLPAIFAAIDAEG